MAKREGLAKNSVAGKVLRNSRGQMLLGNPMKVRTKNGAAKGLVASGAMADDSSEVAEFVDFLECATDILRSANAEIEARTQKIKKRLDSLEARSNE